MIQLPPAAVSLLLKQRTRYMGLNQADIERELANDLQEFVEAVRPLLPAGADRQRFVDIGCGLGFGLMGLRQIYGPHHRFVAVDRDEASSDVGYGFTGKPSTYNDLSLTRATLASVGIADDDIETVNLDADPFPAANADIVMSTLAWGFHFPVETYLAEVNAMLEPGSILIIDLRRGQGQEAVLEPYYTQIGAIPGQKHQRHVLRRR